MKGKIYSYKIVLTLLILLMAGVCFGIGILPKHNKKIYAVSTKTTLDGNEYSALFDGNVIFSVEKVAVNSEEEDGVPKELNSIAGEGFNTFYGNNTSYTFKNLQNGTSNKTVVDNGEFVKLNNFYENGQYINNNNLKHGETKLQEAVMVSFGVYVYNVEYSGDKKIETVKIADGGKTLYAGLTYLSISLEKDGVKIELPDIRNINVDAIDDGGLFFDFSYLITQQDNNSNEGYYNFTLNYMIDYVEYNAEFEFYMINHSSYSNIETYEGVQYYAYPTLGWTEDGSTEYGKSEDSTGYIRYYIGKSGVGNNISYPTLTYDYTKFKLKYTHTANQKNIVYDLGYTVTNQTANLVCNVTASGETTTMPDFELLDYSKSSKSNLVTILLTEPGTYKVEFEYVYTGYNASNAPSVGIKTDVINLAIHGLSVQYSKHNYESAKMEYFELANAKSNHVDLFVPNGYEVNENTSSLKNEKLGFAYKLVSSNKREGNILKTNSIDSLINSNLKNVDNATNGTVTADNNDYAFLINNISKIRDVGFAGEIDTIETELRNILTDNKGNSKINYAQTNQGSIWINGNDQFSINSFYFYSGTPITFDTIKQNVNDNGTSAIANDDTYGLSYTNTTSFNKKGYYLVFIEILPNGTTYNNTKYWQIFAFQYTSSSVDIILETVEGDPVGGGKYTNMDVVVSWKKPGVFDRDINGYYYSVTNYNYSKDELLKTSKRTLTTTENNGYLYANLGSEVKNDTFVKYLIRLESEGETATHKTFTIDRQDISGVRAYLVEQMYSGNTSYYTYSTDTNNNKVPIQYSITDSLATITWNDKASDAKIYASYSYTPFVISETSDGSVTLNKGQTGVATNYELGTTILGSELKREDNPYVIASDSILFNQGIYIIKIWDEAGNYTYYSFVIDQTENWFKLNDEYASNTSKMYGDNVKYSVGDYKTFELKVDNNTNTDLANLITLASSGNLMNFDHYYVGTNNNVSVISNLFQKVGEKYYFTVKNEKIIAYEDDDVDTSIRNLSGTLEFNKEELNGAGYYRRKLYVISRNQLNTTKLEEDASYVSVAINKDNSLGLVYFGSTNNFALPTDGEESTDAKELKYGSDLFDDQDNLIANGLTKAYATSAKHVAFVWNMGTGKYEVESVTYEFYTLKPTRFNTESDGKYYFYGSGQHYDLYVSGKFSNGAQQLSDGTGRAVVRFNGTDETKEGLYVVTRTYKDLVTDSGDDDLLRDDDLVKNYYFIVDRNGIINLSQGIGSYIELELMESEPGFNDFSAKNTNTGTFGNAEDKIYNQAYNIYLSTTKLPATLVVPTGKYFDGTHSSADYYSGELRVTVYFNDVYNQLPQTHKGGAIKIFDSKVATTSNGYFNIDIYDYLTNVNVTLRDRLTVGSENGNWLFLSGEYIVRIQDKVIDETGDCHTTYIGFKITGVEDNGPQVDTYTGFVKNDTIRINTNKDADFTYSATVSQEYLEVVIPKYNADEMENAQVDPNYLIIKQYYNNDKTGINYVNHPYSYKNGVVDITKAGNNVTFNDDGTISVFLDTKLRVDSSDPTSAIDIENLNTPLYYTITVRYKLNKDVSDGSKYEKCYVYHDATCHDVDCQGIKYYEATYTIRIDREAPSENIENNLNLLDILEKDYIEAYDTDTMFENGYHQTSSWLYFTKQYAKYYQGDKINKGYIYVYQVLPDSVDADGKVVIGTEFKSSDVARIYYKQISANADNLKDLSAYNLTLPMIDESKYDGYKDAGFESYSALGLTANNYYEIVEVDKAGNTTQYVIHYAPATAEISIPVSILKTDSTTTVENLGFETSKAPINIFSIEENGDTVVANENFFKIELNTIDGTNVSTILTNVTTDFGQLSQTIVEAMNKGGSSSYILNLISRTKTNVININLIDESKVVPKTAEVLEHVDEKGNYFIDLYKANEYYQELKLWYFATEIVVKYIDASGVEHIDTYVGSINPNNTVENAIEYINLATNEVVKGRIPCTENTTYHITMTDILKKTTPHKFNTSGQDPYTISFEGSNSKNYFVGFDENNNAVYYGYTTATFKFDKTLYEGIIRVKNANGKYVLSDLIAIDETSDPVFNIVKINSIFDETTKKGGIIEVEIELTYLYDRSTESHYITVDTNLASVVLRDANSGEQKNIIEPYNNINFNDNTISGGIGSGQLILNWEEPAENNYFDYRYVLYELLDTEDNNTYRDPDNDGVPGEDFTNKTSCEIITRQDSRGIYRFEIQVYGKDGTYLGNRIFAFEVREISTDLYEVRYKDDQTAQPLDEANSKFSTSELSALLRDMIADEFTINPNTSIPLYISNKALEVKRLSDSVNVVSKTIYNLADKYKFTIYQISKTNAFEIYVATLKVEDTNTLVSDVVVGTNKVTNTTSFTIVGKPNDDAIITATKVSVGDAIIAELLAKNELKIEVRYNGQLVTDNENFTGVYSISGNGQYSFVFKDLAGNIHEFENDADRNNPETIDTLDVYVLREVVVLVNGQAPIANAFYNEAVELTIYRSTGYKTGSIKFEEIKRNGEDYVPKGYGSTYLFEGYGTYRVVITAEYLNPTTKEYEQVKKVLLFTILNVKEARNSIDLTSLSGYNINKVLNQKGENVTKAFMEMINRNANIGGMLVTYEKVMEYAHRLNVSSGKVNFTITYEVKDGDYPTREVELSFTLNNEIPSIDCSINKGDSTKKGFEIHFNAAILYEQVGESYIYINNRLVAHIDETSENKEVKVSTTYKKHGDGDYYVKLLSSSGTILDSYKVTIKEPLNAGAIIIIIVVVAVVGTVVTTIIVLRRKMRIR